MCLAELYSNSLTRFRRLLSDLPFFFAVFSMVIACSWGMMITPSESAIIRSPEWTLTFPIVMGILMPPTSAFPGRFG